LLTSGLEAGFIDPSSPLICITEQELFGQAKVRSREKSLARHEAFSESIRHIAELSIGDPVVHIEHGVGRYQGMERLDSGGIEREYIKLTYANDDSLYLPVEKLHLLSRYGGMADSAPLHRLGSGVWEKARSKASQKAHDVAAELLDIYARREEAKGEVYAIEETDYAAFASEFPFEETPDQETAIAAVIEDLRSTKPMDRLVCGDVGFGKTEVAMRAAFIAVQNKKQVAILVPTTLLANQHFKNFQDRFANWPITIAQLSRFTTGKDTQAHLEKLAKGEIDIVIGTHKLIQPSVKFKHLGLIILDEEHRFGVKQKETFKSLRAQVDILTMTATPIPRTLNMALSDLRALSIIATPPAKRTSVKTFVHEWNDAILVEACKREFYRGGQVYLLHNHVETIAAFADRISGLLPEAKIEIAHGQMPERELERIMQAFYHQKFNLLICTSIIETGIDNPNANTMIIDRADKFGLAQLHQLRGRVGRSWHQAYAWLFTPQAGAITKDAQRRLEVIARNDHLGAGFSLASHDLEIRGAGELLGDEQSGHIQEIGFGLYTQLLEEAVKAIRKGELPRDPLESLKEVCEVNLNESTLIPEDYLPDVGSRLMLYKRLAMLKDETALKDLQVEMIDRFGLFPEPVAHLVEQTRLRLRAQTLGIQKIEVGDQGALIQFNEKPNIDPLKIIQLLQSRSKTLQMKGPNRLRSQAPLANFAQKFEHIQSLLESLEG
jgi:transcription-repair coupling factor (superfamily II helicase)